MKKIASINFIFTLLAGVALILTTNSCDDPKWVCVGDCCQKTLDISGNPFLCLGTGNSAVGTFTISPSNANQGAITWNATGGVSILSGNGTKTVTVRATGNGTLSVKGSNGNACGEKQIFTGLPPQPASILGVTQVCTEGLFSVNQVAGTVSYKWRASDPAVKLSPSPDGKECGVEGVSKTFTLFVKSVNPCGVSVTEASKTITKGVGGICGLQ